MSKERQQNLLNKETDVKNNAQICKGMAEIYASILNKVGIETKVIGVQEKGQVDGELGNNGEKISVPEIYKTTFDENMEIQQFDNERMNDGAKHYYAIVNTEKGPIVQDYLIDSALSRIKTGEAVINDKMPGMCELQEYKERTEKSLPLAKGYVDQIKTEFQKYTSEPTNENAIEFTFNKLNENIDNFGFEESKDFVMSVASTVVPNLKELKNMKIVNLVKESENRCDVSSIYKVNNSSFLLRGGKDSTEISQKAGIITNEEITEIENQGFGPRKDDDRKKLEEVLNVKENNYKMNEQTFTESEVGKATINTPTEEKDIAYNKILNKVHERNNPETIKTI